MPVIVPTRVISCWFQLASPGSAFLMADRRRPQWATPQKHTVSSKLAASWRFLRSLASSSSHVPVRPAPASNSEKETKSSFGGREGDSCEDPPVGNLKRSFFQSLKRDRGKCENHESQQKEVKEVKEVKEKVEETRENVTVSFSLDSLLDFQHSMREHEDLNREDPRNKGRCRKRPNYNNNGRAFFAKGRQPQYHEPLAWRKFISFLQFPVFSVHCINLF